MVLVIKATRASTLQVIAGGRTLVTLFVRWSVDPLSSPTVDN
jgi:hypothetical protein